MGNKSYPPFGSVEQCPKCGAHTGPDLEPKPQYGPAWNPVAAKAKYTEFMPHDKDDPPPCIRRTCGRCGYEWYERPLDYKEK
jgi:ribosomal protein S27AE